MIVLPGLFAALTSCVILVTFFKKKVTYWEALIPFAVGLTLSFLCKFAVTASLTHDVEYHGGWFVKAEYDEAWTEEYEVEVDDYCTRTVTRDGKSETETYKCGSHKEKRTTYHPATYTTYDSNGYPISISSDKFEREAQRHGNRVFHALYHPGQISFGDGNQYVVTWDGSERTFEPMTVEKSWTNKVQASKSTFNFRDVAKDDIKHYQLVNYPVVHDYYHMDSVIGPDIPGMDRANKLLTYWNAKLGRSKQVRMFLIVYKNQPLEAASLQESLWKGGNKNEVVACVGINDNNEVDWGYVFSWTEVDSVKFKIRNFIIEQKKFDPVKVVNFMVPVVRESFIRKEFEDFNYLRVEPPLWGQVLSFFVAIVSQIGVGVYLVQNQFNEDNDPLKIR